MQKHKLLAGKPLDDDLAVAVITELCIKEFKDRLELAKGAKYKNARHDMVSFV